MCGIAGYINIRGMKEHEIEEIAEMINMQRHRGPNDFGMVGIGAEDSKAYELTEKNGNSKIGYKGMVGFTRLSIQDLSIRGHQPMCSEDGSVILSFNGEIYNASSYRDKLMELGYHFKSTTDTEVLLYLYQEYGIKKTARLLNGMFGICIIDSKLNKLFLLRDRVGIKPLYYTFTQNRFAYASECKCFLALKDFTPKLDEVKITEHLSFYKPLDSVLLKDVMQVQPGEIVTLNLENNNLYHEQFFSIDEYERPIDTSDTLERWKERTGEKLYTCIENQKVSDAKIGCQLSGGVDSSIVTYFASKSGVNLLRDSISIIFDGNEKEYSEEAYVDIVQKISEVDTHKKIIDGDYVLKNYEKALWHADSIIGRPNSIGLMLLTKTAKEYVTVLLSGEGADELLGGYTMFTQGKEIRNRLKNEKEIVIETVKKQPEIIHNFSEYVVIAQQKTNEKLCQDILPGYDSKPLINERIEKFNNFQGTDFDKQIKYAMSTYLPELLLCQDKMSMANSIENRVPILDNDFIDFAFTIPEKYLISEKNGVYQGKFLLKEVCADLFGEEFAYRRKMGFGLPYYRYFKLPRFKEYFYDIILEGTKQRGILNSEVLEKWYLNLGNTSWGESELFWKACSLEAWCQMFLDRRQYISI